MGSTRGAVAPGSGTMPAAVLQSPGVIAVEARPVPVPGEDEVLVEVDHCGICGTDLHLLLDGWGDPKDLVAGHEFAGTVVAVGPGVEGWSIGDAVVGGPSPKCGKCRRCREGKPSQCENREGTIMEHHDGAFAGYALVRVPSLLRVPEGLSTREAALAEPLAVALHGITRSGIQPEDRALVIGAGPIGALTLAVLVDRGIGPVTVVEPRPARKRLATQLGATEVIDPSDLESFAPWQPEMISPRAAHVVFECSGKRSAIEAGFQSLRRGGTLVLVGSGMEPPRFDTNRMILNELHVCGSFVYDEHGFDDALALLATGRLPTQLLIEPADVPLSGLRQALSDLASGELAGKVLIAPGLDLASAPGGAGGSASGTTRTDGKDA